MNGFIRPLIIEALYSRVNILTPNPHYALAYLFHTIEFLEFLNFIFVEVVKNKKLNMNIQKFYRCFNLITRVQEFPR